MCKMQSSKIFYFVPILHLISGKVTKVPVEKLSTSEVISKKSRGGYTPRAFRVKPNHCILYRCTLVIIDIKREGMHYAEVLMCLD